MCSNSPLEQAQSCAGLMRFNPSRNLVVQQLWNPATQHALDIDQTSDTSVTLGGERLLLNEASDAMTFLGATTEETDVGVRLIFTFEHRAFHTLIKRVYACYPGTPTIEAWTRLEAKAGAQALQVSDLVGWQLAMPSATARWISSASGPPAAAAATCRN